MDNKAIANILYETADLLEIDGQDSFRIRSYRNAAQAIENHSHQLKDIISEPKQVLAIPGIGKGMLQNLQELFNTGKLRVQAELLQKYHPSMLQLLKIQGLGPKTIALIWSAYKISDVDGVEKLCVEGKIRELPRMGEKHEAKLLKAIQDYRRIGGRFLIDAAELECEKITAYVEKFPGIDKITPAGSLRRGRETVGDLDILVTGKACTTEVGRQEAIAYVAKYPPLMDVIASGDNKISFHVRNGMQVDVRLLPPESFGAAMQYFTGSKAHNVALRQRALKMGYTLNEYSLATLEGEKPVAGKTEEEIYAKLKLDYIPPEMRENLGEIDLAQNHALPNLITQKDLQGDVHMHTIETDGRNTIEEMAEAARERGYKYMAITDHSKNLAFANGLDDKRAVEHIARIREANKKFDGIRIFAGIEVDILPDGDLDLSDDVLAQMDIVIASVHSVFNQESAKMTERLIKAIENPNTSIIGHPTGRIQLRRDSYPFDMHAVLTAAAKHKVAMELNAYPDRLDLNDANLRQAKQHGVKTVINTDSHHTSHMEKIRFGVLQARRAWLTKEDVLNTLPVEKFAKAMKHAW
ncbi:MAG TPA: DNA polymerase/3'-5' exonuclease PolX [Candidatus Acidoferrales bacterium]|nr:DNA polymerase/3'-5' exonuclease PolX [Candidatus Acidoferrales bacterium]